MLGFELKSTHANFFVILSLSLLAKEIKRGQKITPTLRNICIVYVYSVYLL